MRKFKIVKPYQSHDGSVGWTIQDEFHGIVCECRTRALAQASRKMIQMVISEERMSACLILERNIVLAMRQNLCKKI